MSTSWVWKAVPQSEAAARWDGIVEKLPYFSLGQTYAWGQHKADFGWRIYRIFAESGGQVRFAAQCFLKPLRFGAALVWIPGGPVGDYSALQEFIGFLRSQTPEKLLYVRIRPHILGDEGLKTRLSGQSLKPSPVTLSSDQTMWLKLDQTPERLMAGMSSSWRHNLKRSAKYGLKVTRWQNPSAEEMFRIYESMQNYKDLDQQFSLEQLRGLIQHFGDKLVLYRCESAEGELIAFRGCAVLGEMGWDLFAAAAPAARKVYASYALLWSLLLAVRDRGVKTYDLMGIDPERNPGVYNFKQGTGASHVHLAGEWEWSRPRILGPLANWMIQARGASF